MIDLRRLRAFVVVAEEGHVTRAAERLGMQQPQLSRLIHALEADLGAPLFRRTPRGVTLTAAGEALLTQAQALLARADGLPEAVRQAARGEAGRLAIGFTSSAAFHPRVSSGLRRFRAHFPGVAMRLEEAGTGELVAALTEGSLDAAFVRSSVEGPLRMRADDLENEPMIAALPAGHALAEDAAGPLALAALAADDFVLYRRRSGPGLHDAILAACHEAGFNPFIVQEAPRLTATLALVAAGLGVSLVPQSLRRLAVEGVIYRALATAGAPHAPLRLVRLAANTSPTLGRFREEILGS
jgi:DNA-binding transcriptional LysR family regulator